MDSYEREQKVREAQRHLRLRRARAAMLRSRVVASALVAFVLLWGVVFAQMVTGHDPVLGQGVAAGATANEAIGTTDPEELENEDVSPVESEPEPEVEVAPEEVPPEPEFFEPEPVETSQS